MSGADVWDARLELIHPDGRTILECPAGVSLAGDRIAVQPERGAPLLINVLTIHELDRVSDAVPLVLDSGYTVRLSRIAAPGGLLDALVTMRQQRLSEVLRLPGRQVALTGPVHLSWSERGWLPLADFGRLVVDDTHVLLIPDRHQPLSLPLQCISSIERRPGGALRFTGTVSRLSVEVSGSDALVGELAEAIQQGREAGHSLIETALPTGLARRVAEALLTRPCLRTTDPEAEGVDVVALGSSLATGEQVRAWAVLAAMAEDHGIRVGLAITSEAGRVWPVSWGMVSCRPRRSSQGVTVAMPLSEAGECTIIFRTPVHEGFLGEGEAPTAEADMERACADLAPHFEALGLPEAELAEAAGGAWLWPMHQLPHLQSARKSGLHLIPHGSREAWMRELVQFIASS